MMLFRVARPTACRIARQFSTRLERVDSFTGVSMSSVGRKLSAEDAVNNILYNAPNKREAGNRHILSVLVDNEPGVLSKISGLLSARGFNIDSLSVSATNVKELSRMTIVLNGPDTMLEQAGRQLEDLCDVWAVFDYAPGPTTLERELAIVKVKCLPPHSAAKKDDKTLSYEDMMAGHAHRQAILDLANMFGATVNDVGSESMILELVSWSRRVESFVRILEPFGIIEAARSGVIAMRRTTVSGDSSDSEVVRTKIDIRDLPPS